VSHKRLLAETFEANILCRLRYTYKKAFGLFEYAETRAGHPSSCRLSLASFELDGFDN